MTYWARANQTEICLPDFSRSVTLSTFGKRYAINNLRKTSTRVLGYIGLDFRHPGYLLPKMSTNSPCAFTRERTEILYNRITLCPR